jgi:hypothetical protein
MKRGLTLALLTLATSVVVSAQVHGGRASGASMGSGRGATSGFRGSSSLAPRGFAGGFPAGRVGSGIAFGHHPGFVTGSHNRGFHRRYYPGIVGPYYWPYYGWGYPYDAYDSNLYQQDYQQNQPVAMVDPKPDDDRYGDHSFNEERSAPRQAQAPPAPAPEQDPTVLVFHDGHQQVIRNYAIVGQMLWDFSAKGSHKIPLADLDLDTTRKLNDERGVDFVLPKS